MNPDLQSLINFALRALEVLEDDEKWDSETADSIYNTALAEGLLATGPGGYATRTHKALNLGTRYKAP